MGRLLAKTSLPWQGYLLPRPRLHQLVAGLGQGGVVSLVCGPGCGKTAALVEIITGFSPERNVYFLADEGDQDTRAVFSSLLSALEFRLRAGCAPLLQELACTQDQAGLGAYVAERVVELLAGLSPRGGRGQVQGVIALDDLHVVGAQPDLAAFLQVLADHLPAGWLLLLASRSPLPLSLRTCRSHGRSLELNLRSLRLTPKEVATWAQDCWGVHLGISESRTLWRLSEGWPVALVLLGERLRQGSGADQRSRVVGLLRKGKDLNEYLANQVIAGLDPAVFQVLISAAQLPRVNLSRDAVFLPEDGEPILSDLAARGFFVTRAGHGNFSLHPLFKGFIQREHQRCDAEGAASLALAAARHLEAAGRLRNAVSIYLAEGRIAEAVRPLRRLAVSALNASLPFADAQWLDRLPEEVTSQDPWLLMVRARLLQSRAKFEEARPLFRSAARLLGHSPSRDGLLQALLGEALCLYVLGRWEESLSVLRRAEGTASTPSEKSEVLCNMGTVLLNLCRWDEAVERFEVALAQHPAADRPHIEARIDIYRARLFFLRGQYQTAARYAARGVRRSTDLGLELHATALNTAATLLVELGEYQEASTKARAALEVVGARGWSFMQAPVLLCSAGACLGVGEIRDGHRRVREAVRLSQAAGDVEAEVWAETMLGDICRRGVSTDKALGHHQLALAMSKEHQLSWYEIVRAMAAVGMDLAVAGRDVEALAALEQAVAQSRKCGIRFVLATARLYEGWLHARAGREKAAISALSEAMTLCQEGGYLHFLLQEAAVCAPVLALCRRVGCGEFVEQVIAPRLGARARAHYRRLAEGDVYPLDVALGRPSRVRVQQGPPRRACEPQTQEEAELGRRVATLTCREMEILRLIGLGMPNKAIAARLYITEKTVKTHTNRLFRKLGVSNRLQAAISLQSYQRTERLSAKQGRVR